ncbi:dihydroneopterin aldolase [Mucilaginibacter sp.]
MLKVGIYDAGFFAGHGFYEQEQLIGNRFLVTIEVAFDAGGHLSSDDINHTVNYEQLYAIAEDEMKQTKQLLEALAQAMVDRIQNQFPFVQQLMVSVKKINPPLRGNVAWSGVTISLP